MGKRAKEHRKKVLARNAKMKGMEKAYQKVMNEMYQKYLKELEEMKASGVTENEGFVAQE